MRIREIMDRPLDKVAAKAAADLVTGDAKAARVNAVADARKNRANFKKTADRNKGERPVNQPCL